MSRLIRIYSNSGGGIGGSKSFNLNGHMGSNNYFHPSMAFITSTHSVHFWIKYTSFRPFVYVFTKPDNSYGYTSIRLQGSTIQYNFSENANNNSGRFCRQNFSTNIPSDTWCLVSFNVTTNNYYSNGFFVVDAYVNGSQLVGQSSNTIPPLGDWGGISVRNIQYNRTYTGGSGGSGGGTYISNLSMFDVSFTSQELLELYNNGKPPDLNQHSRQANLRWWSQFSENDTYTSGNFIYHSPQRYYQTVMTNYMGDNNSASAFVNDYPS